MYRYELHMHTKEGSACAVDTIEEMIKQYVKIGFSGAAVTNHFIGGNTSVSRDLPWEELISQYSRAYFDGKEIAERLDSDLRDRTGIRRRKRVLSLWLRASVSDRASVFEECGYKGMGK